MPPKDRRPRHDDEAPARAPCADGGASRADLPSTAASGPAQDAPRPSATNRTAPVRAERGAAVERGAEHGAPGPAPDHETRGAAPGSGGAAAAPWRGDAPATPTVLHVDIDAFFAAIEQQRDPRLRGRPVIVGAGVIASCSYEARARGLKAGMPLSEARRLCPEAVVIAGHAQVYRCFAEAIFERCRAVSPAVETYLDEAYCDLTGTERLHGGPLAAARRLKAEVLEATGLTVTCGVGPNRMLARLIGKTAKPDGLARIEAHEAEAFLTAQPVERLPGIGHAHARTLRSMNVRTVGELRALGPEVLAALFGAPGRLIHERAFGRDTAAVQAREVPLSISRETSFHRDTADRAELEGMLEYLAGRACRTARELGLRPRTVAVRLRYTDGERAAQARSLKVPSDADPVVIGLARDLLGRLFTRRVALHHLGLALSGFVPAAAEQGALFDEAEAGRRAALYRAFDGVRRAYGHGVLVSGRALHLRGRLEEDTHGFVLRTPSLTK